MNVQSLPNKGWVHFRYLLDIKTYKHRYSKTFFDTSEMKSGCDSRIDDSMKGGEKCQRQIRRVEPKSAHLDTVDCTQYVCCVQYGIGNRSTRGRTHKSNYAGCLPASSKVMNRRVKGRGGERLATKSPREAKIYAFR